MKIWLITDTHFNHKKMVEYCGRPENFEAIIAKNLVESVKSDDLLIHLGDVCIGATEHMHEVYIKPIKGTKILVKGNHDHKSNKWYLEHGWDFVCETFSDKLFGLNILFSHKPKLAGNFDLNIHGHFHNTLPRLLKGEWKVDGKKERNESDLLELFNDGKHKLLALEYTNYKPVLLKTFIKNYDRYY